MPKKNSECPIESVVNVIGGKWTIQILRELLEGEKRFSELQKNLDGISPRTLSIRLKDLEGHQIINREVHSSIPPNVTYFLTEKGKALESIFDEMTKFGKNWLLR